VAPARRAFGPERVTDRHRYRAELAYVGTDFHGWQRQRNADRTVQALLEKALSTVARAPVTAIAAGRTDAGVHADGQVVHFDLPAPMDPNRIRAAVNGLLPSDARLLRVELAAAGFHARRDALWKEYLYRWSRAEVIAPRDAPFVAPIAAGADPARIAADARDLAGTRDFGVFAVRHPAGEPAVRTLHSVSVECVGDEIRVLLRGDGFLRGMARSICGVLADVGRGKAPAGRIAGLLASGDRSLLRPKAPARGLTLVRVSYGNEVKGER
jgi:tRNA pseudouridine38-40 synthase